MPITEQGLVASLDKTLREYNLANYNKLQEPLEEVEVVAHLKRLDVQDRDFHAVFKWKNGFDPYRDTLVICEIARLGTILSLEAIPRLIDGTNNELWPASYIPFLLSSRGQVVLFNNGPGPDHGKLHFKSGFMGREQAPVSCYASIAAWIETTVTAYEQLALQYDPVRHGLRVDIKKYNKIAATINKGTEFWQSKMATKLFT
jgi:hypothetical protein